MPIRIKVTGRLGDDDLARLELAVANLVAHRLTWHAGGPARPDATPSGGRPDAGPSPLDPLEHHVVHLVEDK